MSDEWVESYDSMDSDDELEIDEPTPSLKLAQKFDSHKRVAITAESEESTTESDRVSDDDSADEIPASEDHDKLKSNPAWANAMSKVLRSKKSSCKKAIVLSKAKKVVDVKEKKPKLDFEIVRSDGDIRGTEIDEVKEEKPDLKKKFSAKEHLAKGRVKPSVLDRDRERTLMKIATKGVIQLFNAVRQQQKSIDKTVKKAGKSERKREKILETVDKKKFLNSLTSSVQCVPINEKIKLEKISESSSSWSVLRDDFMMGTKFKDWDKKEKIV